MAQKDTHFYIDIARVDEEERMVYGYGTRGDIKDSYGTIIDLESVRKCIPDYAKWGNIREMHQNSAVGRADDITVDDKGVYLGVKVVDDNAWKKVTERVYKGFSVGGKKDYQDGDRIFLKEITEFSLVDRPSNEGCPIDEFRLHGGNDMDAEQKPVEKTETTDVKRYAGEEIGDCQTALSALEAITWLMGWEEGENHPEAEEQTAALKAAIEALKKFIASEIKEVSTETAAAETPLMELAAGTDDDVTRSGSRHSTEDMARLNTIRDCLRDLGVEMCEKCAGGDDTQKAAGDNDDVQRVATLEDDVKRLAGENETLKGEKEQLVQRVAELEKEPAQAKGALKVVGKEDDTDSLKRTQEEADLKRIEALPANEAAAELVKRAHQSPMIIR